MVAEGAGVGMSLIGLAASLDEDFPTVVFSFHTGHFVCEVTIRIRPVGLAKKDIDNIRFDKFKQVKLVELRIAMIASSVCTRT